MAGRSKSVRLYLDSDVDGLKRGIGSAERELSGLNRHIGGITRAAKIAAGAFIAFEVGGKVVEGIKSVTEAAIHAEASQKILAKTVENSGVSWRKHGEVIEHNLKVMGTSKGFLEGPMRDAFDKLIASTHNQRKSFTDLSLAIDISRARHIGLTQASILVAKTTQGNVTGLKRLGIATVAVTDNVDKLAASHAKAKDSGQKFSAAQMEQYKAQVAAAKAADKHATAIEVLGVLQKQFGGSGKAYADSTAGGIDKINAQVEQLKIEIGQKLLPYAQRFVQWLSKELPIATATAQRWIRELTPTFLSIKQAVGQVVGFVRTHWSQISQIVRGVYDTVAGVLRLLGDLLHGRWGKIWGDAVQIVKGAVETVRGIVRLIGPYIVAALRAAAKGAATGALAVADKIVAGIKSAPGRLAGLAGDLGGKIASALRQAASDAYAWALRIGQRIAQGVLDGLAGLPGKVAAAVNPFGGTHTLPTGTSKAGRTGHGRAGGGMIPGRYSDGDRVPAMLAGGEAVLNPMQIGMVNAGMTVQGALAATGAPTTGYGFQGGKRPKSGSLASLLTRGHRTAGKMPPTPGDRITQALGREGLAWDSRAANVALAIAQADAAGDASGNVAAYQQDILAQVAMRDRIQAILAHPAKALGVIGGRLSSDQRTTLINALAAAIAQIHSDNVTITDLQHPAGDGTGGGDTGSGAAAAVYDPLPDVQAQLAQSQKREAIAVRGGQLSEATLRTLTGPGDIGMGGGPRVSVMQVLGDQRSLQAFASATTQGMGMQPSRAANRASINA